MTYVSDVKIRKTNMSGDRAQIKLMVTTRHKERKICKINMTSSLPVVPNLHHYLFSYSSDTLSHSAPVCTVEEYADSLPSVYNS